MNLSVYSNIIYLKNLFIHLMEFIFKYFNRNYERILNINSNTNNNNKKWNEEFDLISQLLIYKNLHPPVSREYNFKKNTNVGLGERLSKAEITQINVQGKGILYERRLYDNNNNIIFSKYFYYSEKERKRNAKKHPKKRKYLLSIRENCKKEDENK
jgi:hypothetical protein